MLLRTHRIGIALLLACLLAPLQSLAAVSDVQTTDVTPRSFTVVWASDEAITDASLRIFQDVDGTIDVTASLNQVADSATVAGSHANGLARVVVAGLDPDSAFFIQTVTDGASGVVEFPAPGALIPVITNSRVTRSDMTGGLITNDVIQEGVNTPADEATPLAGGTVVARVIQPNGQPITGSLSAQVGADNTAAAFLNFNNFFSIDNAVTLELSAGDIVEVREYRGLACAPGEQQRIRYGRVPVHEESPEITELETLAACFSADRACDNSVNALDVQFVLNAFNEALGSCRFNPYLDIVVDGEINALDVQAVLNRFGDSAPF